jgi:hypothetical protein
MKLSGVFLLLICLTLLAAPGGAFARQENPTPPAPAQPTAAPATAASPGAASPAAEAAILSPAPGEALQGVARIVAHAGGENFQSVEISFAYSGDQTGVWFLIAERSQPLSSDAPVEWDTSLITDGNYSLRLVVSYTDGASQAVEVPGVRVRNYTVVETNTPAPAAQTPTPAAETPAAPAATELQPGPTAVPARPSPTLSPTPEIAPTHTPQPPNPAAIAPGRVQSSAARGAAATAGLFVLGWAYWSLRRLGRRR